MYNHMMPFIEMVHQWLKEKPSTPHKQGFGWLPVSMLLTLLNQLLTSILAIILGWWLEVPTGFVIASNTGQLLFLTHVSSEGFAKFFRYRWAFCEALAQKMCKVNWNLLFWRVPNNLSIRRNNLKAQHWETRILIVIDTSWFTLVS